MTILIIGISGNMGAGKTTLAKALALDLQATMVGWDEFDTISKGPKDYVNWHQLGKNYNEWDYPSLANVLKCLKAGQSIQHPVLKDELKPTHHIIFDAPLGRLHIQTGQYIDLMIHISIPLDISLCRHLIRDFKKTRKTKDELIAELEYYLFQSRPLFFDDAQKTSADFIINGMFTTDKQIQRIKKYLKEKNNALP